VLIDLIGSSALHRSYFSAPHCRSYIYQLHFQRTAKSIKLSIGTTSNLPINQTLKNYIKEEKTEGLLMVEQLEPSERQSNLLCRQRRRKLIDIQAVGTTQPQKGGVGCLWAGDVVCKMLWRSGKKEKKKGANGA